MIRKFIGFLLFVFFVACSNTASRPIEESSYSMNYPRSCTPNHRIVRVGIDTQFTPHQRLDIQRSLRYLEYLHVTAQIVGTRADVVVVRWYNYDSRLHRCVNGILGEYAQNRNFVLIDPDCSLSDNQFKISVIHEIGHWLGMHHICEIENKTNEDCSNVGRGIAIMNPFLDPGHSLIPTRLDVMEYDKACAFLFCNRHHRN